MKSRSILLCIFAFAMVGSLATVSSASASPRPVAEYRIWAGEEPTESDLDVLQSSNTGGGDFQLLDECDSGLPYSCDLFTGPAAPLIGVGATGTYPVGSKASWTYTVPSVFGPDTYLETVHAAGYHVTGPTEDDFEQSQPEAYLGLGDGTSFTHSVTDDAGGALQLDGVEGEEGDREVEFGIETVSSASLTQDHWGGLAFVVATLGDDEPAVLDIDPLDLPSGWVNEDPITIPYSAEDNGLGLKDVDLISAKRNNSNPWYTGGTYWDVWNPTCSGAADDPCPRQTPSGSEFEVRTDELREGQNLLTIVALDLHENADVQSIVEAPIKVDTIDPEIALDGTFMSAPGMVLDGPSYVLDSDASDGEVGKENSGVVDLEVLIDDVVIDSDAASCSTENCTLDLSTPIDPDDYTNGEHVLKVKATDAVGHVTTETVEFEVDR